MSDMQDPNPSEPVGGTPLSLPRGTLITLLNDLRTQILSVQDKLFARHRALNPLPAGLDLNTLSDAQLVKIWENGYPAGENTIGTGQFEKERLESEWIFLMEYVHGQKPASELAADYYGLQSNYNFLQLRVASLTTERDALKGQLDAIRADRPSVPDDFATAVSHSLDSIQSRMAQLSNPVSDFAVREFSIEAKVAIDVSPLGTVAYRFIHPEDNVSEAQVSKLAMTVVPIPKQTTAGIWTGADFTPALGVEEIPGLSADNLQRLHDQQIFTISDLLHAGSRVKSTLDLAALLNVSRAVLEQWISYAQLMTVRDITAEHAQVLYYVDVRSLRTLAESDAAFLVDNFNYELGASGQATPAPITLEQAEGWIRVAQAFVGISPEAPATTPAA